MLGAVIDVREVYEAVTEPATILVTIGGVDNVVSIFFTNSFRLTFIYITPWQERCKIAESLEITAFKQYPPTSNMIRLAAL